MRIRRTSPRRVVWTVVKGWLVAVAGIIAALTVITKVRKLSRAHRGDGFPRAPPTAVPVSDSTVITTYTYGDDLYEDMLDGDRRGEGTHPVRDVHHQGRRDGPAVQAGADPCGRAWCRGPCRLRRVREPRRPAELPAVPGAGAGAAVSAVLRLDGLQPATLGEGPPQDPRRRRHGRRSSAGTTSARSTPRSGATPT